MGSARGIGLSVRLLVTAIGVCLIVAPAAQAATGTIKGRVDDRNGLPIAGATVDCGAGGSRTSGQGGDYTIAGAPEGTHTCTASKSGFIPAAKEVTVAAGQATRVDFELSPAPRPGRISGTVSDTKNALPINGATVDCGPAGTATSGGLGNYALSDVSAGAYECMASKPGYAQRAQIVTVRSGQTTTADFGLATGLSSSVGVVSGVVTDTAGLPLRAATVGCSHTGGLSFWKSSATSNNGSYTLFELPHGTYDCSAWKDKYQSLTVRDVFVSGGYATRVDFRLRPEVPPPPVCLPPNPYCF